MAKKRVSKSKTRTRVISKKVTGSRRRKSNSGFKPMNVILASAAYGGCRAYLSNLISPITSKLGALGGYSDELVLGAAGYYIAKGKVKFIPKSLGLAALTIEAASVGNQLVQRNFNGNTSSVSGVITR